MKILFTNIVRGLDENTKVKFNQWGSGTSDPMDEYKRDPSKINDGWFLWHKKQRYFSLGQTAICFLKLSDKTWLLTTIKRITKVLPIVGDTGGVGYEADELTEYKSLFGRVIIKYHKTHQAQGRWLSEIKDELEVLQILPAVFDGEDFPGYDKIRLSWRQLETIIVREKRDWVAALKNQKAVYLITDTLTGKHYVGSATSKSGMLLSRWSSYIDNGHGGNKELREIYDDLERGFEYIKNNFQYTILENYNQRVDDGYIKVRETWWKETLHSRKFGYNKN